MARIVGYIAASLDGYIADLDETLTWLTQRTDIALGEHDYDSFLAGIRTVVMGRATFDWLIGQNIPWPYAGQRCYVVTSHPLPETEHAIAVRHDVPALIAELRALEDGDVWMLGGGQLQSAFISAGALDELEVFVISQLLGRGRPLFPPTDFGRSLSLVSAKALGQGCARLHYILD